MSEKKRRLRFNVQLGRQLFFLFVDHAYGAGCEILHDFWVPAELAEPFDGASNFRAVILLGRALFQ